MMPSEFLHAKISSMNTLARESVGLKMENATAFVSLSLG